MYRSGTSEWLGQHYCMSPWFSYGNNMELLEGFDGCTQIGARTFQQEPGTWCTCNSKQVDMFDYGILLCNKQINNMCLYFLQAVDITSCGNFTVIALSSGHIDVYNMQSGLHRGYYGKDKGICLLCVVHQGGYILVVVCRVNQVLLSLAAHGGPVRGVAVDALNQLTVSVGADHLLKIWKFKSKELIFTHSLPSAPACSLLHRDRYLFDH